MSPIPERKKTFVDPKTLAWIPWTIYNFWFMGSSMLGYCDFLGEKLAWFFGITSPKYYYEIEEFKRMQEEEEEEKKNRQVEEQGWTNTNSEFSIPNTAAGEAAVQQPQLQG